MGKYIKIIVFVTLVIIMTSNCYATEGNQYYNDFLKIVPDEFSKTESDDVLNLLSIKNIFSKIKDVFLKDIKDSLKLTFLLSSLLILFVILNKFESENKYLKQTVYGVFSVVSVSLCFEAIEESFLVVKNSVEASKVFSYSTIPIVLGLCLSSASSMSGAVFSMSVSFISALMENISNYLLIPLCVIYLSFALINNLTLHIGVNRINEQIKKFIKWTIGIFLTLFSFTMILQNFLSASSDSLLKHSIKSAVGSIIPVIGGTLSSSIDSIFTIVSSTKTTIGVFGIIVICTLFLPALSTTFCYGLSLSAVKFIAESFEENKIAKNIAIISDVFYILTAICSACVVMMILSFLVICINIV